jgi:hypothetical protein
MLTEAQIQYVEMVLGASVDYFSTPPQAEPELHQALVLTHGLAIEESVLLSKILASVQLKFHHMEVSETRLGVCPEGSRAVHVLAFYGDPNGGRFPHGETIWWSLPTLNDMLGNSPNVAEKKRATWALLQQFAKECAT